MTEPIISIAMTSPPFLPFTRPSIDEPTITEVAQVLRSGWLTGGPKVLEFEAALSRYCQGRTVRTFNSGSAALTIALRLAGIGPDDEVLTSPLTWVATPNVVLEVGARPVFVDVDPVSRNIDLSAVEANVGPRTRALLPVDLAGLPVNRERLYAIASKHRLRVIEDAAQSLGAQWHGQPIGASGDFVAFSFHANKNITTGEGGALVIPDDIDSALCERMRLQGVFRNQNGDMDVDIRGTKSNLTDIAATIGIGQLKRLSELTHRRRELARYYFECIRQDMGLDLPAADFVQSNWHMFQVLLPIGTDRRTFIEAMKTEGIGVGVHYPAAHLFTLYRTLGYAPGDFPVAEDIGRRTVTLPLFAAMSHADVQRVCIALEKTLLNAGC
ncbi:MAG: DegT/DnrJ/EryC1/StrS aminotransferase family protein [Methylococcaceae bacterium]